MKQKELCLNRYLTQQKKFLLVFYSRSFYHAAFPHHTWGLWNKNVDVNNYLFILTCVTLLHLHLPDWTISPMYLITSLHILWKLAINFFFYLRSIMSVKSMTCNTINMKQQDWCTSLKIPAQLTSCRKQLTKSLNSFSLDRSIFRQLRMEMKCYISCWFGEWEVIGGPDVAEKSWHASNVQTFICWGSYSPGAGDRTDWMSCCAL